MTHALPEARQYAPGIGFAVADRTINRIKQVEIDPKVVKAFIKRDDHVALEDQIKRYCVENDIMMTTYHVRKGGQDTVEVDIIVTLERQRETWADVARRVALGNALLDPKRAVPEFLALHDHLRRATTLMSGRHLQHGDETQIGRNIEVYTNCSTAATSMLSFYLLLNGSGVGRSYDDDMMAIDWSLMPWVVTVCDQSHADVGKGLIRCMDAESAKHLYRGAEIVTYRVPDSREGWTKAVEKIEVMAFEGTHSEKVLVLDFSDVRCKGSPIKGMQDRPASGPAPLMNAINNITRMKHTKMDRWRQAMYVDHYQAECVLVGGARRAARIATKSWRDKNVLDFIKVKQGGQFLWTANNSVMVDAEFWSYVKMDADEADFKLTDGEYELYKHAADVIQAVAWHSYYDGTGEPGLINADKLEYNPEGISNLTGVDLAPSGKLELDPETISGLMEELVRRFKASPHKMIVNPCGEIALTKIGGYCVIADVVPYHAESIEDAEDAFKATTRALIRTNLMSALYEKEVKRTNRIGVGMTGLHEFAWKFFSYGFRDLIDEKKSQDFWMTLASFKWAIDKESREYSKELGVNQPHTNSTMKPAGTTSKLFGLTEGVHLPARRWYLRWVQFRNDDPLVQKYADQGYPVRKLKTYEGTTIVGFPTEPTICTLGMGDKLVLASEATPEEQYQWLRLLEKYWIEGVDDLGAPLNTHTGNQISYTLKYNPAKVDYAHFLQTLIDGQSTVRCCSVMPSTDASAYEYQPEQPINEEEFNKMMAKIHGAMHEDIGLEHVDCEGAACPISFDENV